MLGNPNTGKSTLFTGLSGVQTRIGNYAGCTVEKKVGRLSIQGRSVRLVDLPGTYSLAPRSPDEMLAVDVLLGRVADVGRPDVIVCIVDAANLERNLFLFTQLRELRIPIVLCLNMWDAVARHGQEINLAELSSRLGVQVVTTTAHHRVGLEELRGAILQAAGQPPADAPAILPEPVRAEADELARWLDGQGTATEGFLATRALLDVEGEAEQRLIHGGPRETAERLKGARTRLAEAGLRLAAVESISRYAWIRQQLDGVVRESAVPPRATTDRIDAVVTHWASGLLIFLAVMFLVFQAVYTAAQPLMSAVEGAQEAAAGVISSALAPGMLRSLLVDGIVAGVGSVLVFIPQIGLLFLFIALLEDCGYMARAAYLIDRLMLRLGLSGRSFLPLMSSFACAIPGIMATRAIENRRDRLTTMLVAPLMSCSARLPVYTMLIGAFVPAIALAGGWIPLQGLTLFAMYSLGAVVAVPIAWLLKKTVFRGPTPPFVMELPEYKWPSPWIVAQRVISQVRRFVEEAGTLIFFTTVLVWAAGYFPGDRSAVHDLDVRIERLEEESGEDDETLASLKEERNAMSAALTESSYLGRAGRAVEPVFTPLGWDWRIGVAVISSFPAREVVVASLGTIFSLGGDTEADDPSLASALQSATWPDGRPLFTLPVALSVMVFFALCAQCGATLMVIRRESGSWTWPVVTFVYMTALAWLAAWGTYALSSRLLG
ncbi:MAG: ferrous iron transport protein B [Planctomyces sp.]|nr:ferrous iron transport protein B [Planctomyces sp.]